MYDPMNPSAKMTDHEQRTFDGVIVDELFYMTDKLKDTNSYRKLNEQEAMVIKTREVVEFSPKQTVYVKN